ncbi:hypothetical protein V5O48_014400 [Marasmius crinis-equi]|uniref:Uncharacterized protein n=1 Tax=Marasmius crinis-equi TaxID=585013 RepID=A0ABR3EXS8_9AGAR
MQPPSQVPQSGQPTLHRPPVARTGHLLPQTSQATECDSEAEYDDGQVYDTAFLNALNKAEAQQLNTYSVAPVAPESPSKRRLRVVKNAPGYLHQEASRRASMASATGQLNAASSPSAEALAAIGLDADAIAAILQPTQQPAATSTAPTPGPSQPPALVALQTLLATYQSTLSAQGAFHVQNTPDISGASGAHSAFDAQQQLAAQRSVSLPCGAPPPSAPPNPPPIRSTSVAPVLPSQPYAAPLPSAYNKPAFSPNFSDHSVVFENPGAPQSLVQDSHVGNTNSSPSEPAVSPPSAPSISSPAVKGRKARVKSSATASPPKQQGGRPTKEQEDFVASSFRDMDEVLFTTASEINANPKAVLDKYLKRFNLGTKKNPWNHYQGWAASSENVLMEMERLKGTEYDGIYQAFMRNPDRKPSVEEMGLTWPLFQAEHGVEKAKDLLAAWDSMCDMDLGFVVQSKGDRKRVWEGHVRRLHNFLDMLRNVFQMHVFAIGVGGQVNTDAGLHFVYQNYESQGFAESGFLKSIDHRETKEQYTDQEVVAMALERGYEIVRSPNNSGPSKSAHAIASATAPPRATPTPPAPPTAPTPPAPSTVAPAHTAATTPQATSFLRAPSTLTPAPSSAGDADFAMQDASGINSGGDVPVKEEDVDVQPALLELALQCNVSFGKARKFPWFSLTKECYRRGIQVANFPPDVKCPWMEAVDPTRKKGVRTLTAKHQRLLLTGIQSETAPLLFKSVEALDIQTDAIPIWTYAPGIDGEQKPPVFASDLSELDSLRAAKPKKKAPKRLKLEEPQPKLGKMLSVPPIATDIPFSSGVEGASGSAGTGGGRPRPKAVKSKPLVESDDEDELEVATGNSSESDIYGLGLAANDDDGDYRLSPPGTSSKRKRGTGKGKERADPNATPKPSKKPAPLAVTSSVGFTLSERITENRLASTKGRNIPASEFQFQTLGASTIHSAATEESGKPLALAVPATLGPVPVSTEPSGSRAASSSKLAVNLQGSGGTIGAAGRARYQGPPPTPSTAGSAPIQAPTLLPINAPVVPTPQLAATPTTPAPQPLNPTLSALLNLLTPEQLVALATLRGAAMANNTQGGGGI